MQLHGFQDSLSRDRVIYCSKHKLRERLLLETNLTIPCAIRIVQTYEEAEKQSMLIAIGNTVKKLWGNSGGSEKKANSLQGKAFSWKMLRV